MKKIALIGSTGSVGRQTLEVIERNPFLSVVSLTGHKNGELLLRQIEKFKPEIACLTGGNLSCGGGVRVYSGEDSALCAVCESADIVVVAIAGFSALEIVLKAIDMGKTVALASKEALVCGGELVMKKAREKGVEIIPLDSEHSAIWQALGFKKTGFKKLILTASGGPFRTTDIRDLENVTPEAALKHPNWNMGKKITVDCATMLNKGFEVIEAHHLFSAPAGSVEVVVHPQSVVHSMVEFADNSVLAEMSCPDMAQPIQIALTYPERLPTALESLDFTKLQKLEFFPPDRKKFPCLKLAEDCFISGGTSACILNAASEIAVDAFLSGGITFTAIARVIEETLLKVPSSAGTDILSLKEADALGREAAKKLIKRYS